ncbi:hypothetical protein KY343_05885 [Candidatus Woesearchaeota archaeon]|nr:hypothetical protein [Candidatus Woesearchaeota archaeon]
MPNDEQENHRILHLFGNGSPLDIGSVLENLDQDVWDQIAELSGPRPSVEDETPYFSDLTDELLERTSKIPKEEREIYVKRAHDFWEIVAGYDDPYFVRNFFGYLFDRTEGMEVKIKREFVLSARFVYDSIFYSLYKKFGEEVKPESSISAVRPNANLKDHLGFDKKHYDILREELSIRKCIDDKNEEIYRKETASDVIELVAERRKVA